jgi:hypothetical protein
MKYHLPNLDSKINKLFYCNNRLISEQQIIELQELFLTPGFHQYPITTVKDARALMYTFLDALRCYQIVGCMTANTDLPLRKSIFDINDYLWQYGYLGSSNYDKFFIEEFDIDFLWIEPTQHNEFDQFKEKLAEFNIDKQIPIIVFVQ